MPTLNSYFFVTQQILEIFKQSPTKDITVHEIRHRLAKDFNVDPTGKDIPARLGALKTKGTITRVKTGIYRLSCANPQDSADYCFKLFMKEMITRHKKTNEDFIMTVLQENEKLGIMEISLTDIWLSLRLEFKVWLTCDQVSGSLERLLRKRLIGIIENGDFKRYRLKKRKSENTASS